MDENYYDILEININASPEIIEKAYKTLVKKYHPDLQEINLKSQYEEKIKKINEAYEILSNTEKRKIYDLNLSNNKISENDYNNLINENINLKNEINYLKNNYNKLNNNNHPNNQNSNANYNNQNNKNYNDQNKNSNYNTNNNSNKEFNNAINKAYYDAYIHDLKSRGYKIKYRKTFKDFLALIITIFLIIFTIFILLQIPFTKNYLINLYNENPILKFVVDLFLNIFK